MYSYVLLCTPVYSYVLLCAFPAEGRFKRLGLSNYAAWEVVSLVYYRHVGGYLKVGGEGGPPCDWPTLDNAIAVSTLASGWFFYYGVFSTLTNF